MSNISSLHEKKLLEFNKKDPQQMEKLERRLEKAQKQLDKLSQKKLTELDQSQISQKFSLAEEIEKIKREIEELKEKPTKYYLLNGDNLLNYYKNKSESHTTVKIKKGGVLDLFKKSTPELDSSSSDKSLKRGAIVQQSVQKYLANNDPEYFAPIEQREINEENYCFKCECFRILKSNEAKMICEKCGAEEMILMDSDKPSLKDPPPESRYYEYQRIHYFCEWLANIQNKESYSVPKEVIDAVYVELSKNKIEDLTKLTEQDILKVLTDLRKKTGERIFCKQYYHTTQILYRITKIPPFVFTQEQEQELKDMFIQIQEPFIEICPDSRNNFISYPYIFYKLCQIQVWRNNFPKDSVMYRGYQNIMNKLKLHKAKDKLYQHDQMWRQICKKLGGREAGWPFIDTNFT
jgi:Poxvirus Late Transcription Factor VLTF3 like